MSGTTTKGIPYAAGGDGANTIDTSMQALAEYIDALQGPFTTSQRDLFTSGQKWQGRIIYNSTTKRHEWWDPAATKWRPLTSSRRVALMLSTL